MAAVLITVSAWVSRLTAIIVTARMVTVIMGIALMDTGLIMDISLMDIIDTAPEITVGEAAIRAAAAAGVAAVARGSAEEALAA